MSRTLAFPPRASRAGSIGPACRKLAGTLRVTIRDAINAWATKRAIRALQSLDDRLLDDIGLTRSEIEWRVRHHAWW